MFGDNLHFTTKKYHHFTPKNTPIVPQHSGDSLPGFSHFPRVSPKSQNTPWRQHSKLPLNQMKHNLFSYLPTPQKNHLLLCFPCLPGSWQVHQSQDGETPPPDPGKEAYLPYLKLCKKPIKGSNPVDSARPPISFVISTYSRLKRAFAGSNGGCFVLLSNVKFSDCILE